MRCINFKMASVSRCRVSLHSLRQSASLLRGKTKAFVAQSPQCAASPACPSSGVRAVCGSAAIPKSNTNLVQAVTKSFSFQMSKNFQKFPPILACNALSIAVAENLTDSGEVEEGAEGEDEATSGRKRIRPPSLPDGDP